MVTAKKECKVCGKLYDYCHTESRNKFRWQDVACSPECGEKYFEMIRKSRMEKQPVAATEEHYVVESSKKYDDTTKQRRSKYHVAEKTLQEIDTKLSDE